MALSSVDFNTTFDYTTSPKKFSFTDTTDYASQGIALTDVTGVIKVVAPSGVTVYNNTNHSSPDINPDVSTTNTTTIPLPLLADGTVQKGTYTITYTVRVNATTLSAEYDTQDTKSINFQYTSPTVDLEITANLVTPLMKSTDNTSYNYTPPTGGVVTPTITRDHKLFYPATLGLSAISGTGSVVSTATFYTQENATLQYSSSCTSTLSYSLGGGFYISDSVVGYDYYDLNADPSLCTIYCGLRTAYNNWFNNKGTATAQSTYLPKYIQLMSIATLAQQAIDCGRTDDVAAYINEMKNIGGFTDGCGCPTGDEPILVTGTGGSGTVIVEAGTGITVSSSVSGTTTTYTVSLTGANATKLAAAFNTTLVAGDGITISSVTDDDGNIIYTVTNNRVSPELVVAEYTIDMTPGSLPTITRESFVQYGTTLAGTTMVNDNNGSVSDWQTKNNSFTVSTFNTPSKYYPKVEAIQITDYAATGDPKEDLARPINVQIVEKGASSFKIRMNDELGNPITGYAASVYYSQIKLIITITA